MKVPKAPRPSCIVGLRTITQSCSRTYTYTHTHAHACTHTCAHTRTHTRAHTHTHPHTHTHTHTRSRTHACSRTRQEELGSPALAFVRTVCALMSLDARCVEAVSIMRRQLLKLLKVGKAGAGSLHPWHSVLCMGASRSVVAAGLRRPKLSGSQISRVPAAAPSVSPASSDRICPCHPTQTTAQVRKKQGAQQQPRQLHLCKLRLPCTPSSPDPAAKLSAAC